MRRFTINERQQKEATQRILVVDDDPDMRRVLSLLLRKQYLVIEASGGLEALAIIERVRPRLVLLDVAMPGLSGIETLEAAARLEAKPSIIMLTSEDDIELAKRALELGAVEYVTKPFGSDDLLEKIHRLLKFGPGEKRQTPYRPWRLG